MPRPDGRGSPVEIWGNASACFTGRAAVSQGKHQQLLTQINRLKQTAGIGDHGKKQYPRDRVLQSENTSLGKGKSPNSYWDEGSNRYVLEISTIYQFIVFSFSQ